MYWAWTNVTFAFYSDDGYGAHDNIFTQQLQLQHVSGFLFTMTINFWVL
jgi:hypothetical protein